MPNYININQLGDPDWRNASTNTYLDHNIVTIWRISVSDLVLDLAELQSLLNSQETEKVLRYKQESDRNRKIASRAVLRILLSRYIKVDPKAIRFKTDQNQKLYIENPTSDPIHFNVSHAGNYILIAINDCPVGVDVEHIDASFSYQNVLSFSFNQQEIDFVENSKLPNQTFYQLWTRKECLLKATGKGLVDDLAKIPSLDGVHQHPTAITNSTESWQVSGFNVNENHLGSAAFNPVKTALQFFNFQL